MNQFIEFMKEYWFQLATGLFAVIEIILIIVKRKPKSIDDFLMALSELEAFIPELVIESENLTKMAGAGVMKKKVVIQRCLVALSKKLGRKLSDNEVKSVEEILSKKIEIVLSTPTKKEIKNEK